MIEEFDLSFLDLTNIEKNLRLVESRDHGLVENGFSSYNFGKPIFEYSALSSLKIIIERCIKSYSTNNGIPNLKIINSWFNISLPQSKLKPHKHEESVVSGAFYISGKSDLIFPNTRIPPYSGLLIIFPSDLVHYTEEEQNERIVISFNTEYL